MHVLITQIAERCLKQPQRIPEIVREAVADMNLETCFHVFKDLNTEHNFQQKGRVPDFSMLLRQATTNGLLAYIKKEVLCRTTKKP